MRGERRQELSVPDLSAGQVRAALDGRVVFSFVLRPLRERLHAR